MKIDDVLWIVGPVLVFSVIFGTLPLAERLVQSGRVKNRYAALAVAVGIFTLLTLLLALLVVGVPTLWSMLPQAVTEPVITLGAIGFSILFFLFFILMIIGGVGAIVGRIIQFFRNTKGPFPTKTAQQLLDTLEDQADADKQPEVALTVKTLRDELYKQSRDSFRQAVWLTAASFVAGVIVSIAVQLLVSR